MPTEAQIKTANTLVEYCRTNREMEGLDTLYDPDAVSVEAMVMEGMDSAETHGIAGIKGKHEWFDGAFEVHDASVDGPFMHGDDRFALIFQLDATERKTGERIPMKEVAVYHVNPAGKIVREEFFYTS